MRFQENDEVIIDSATGLMWTRDAAPAEFPLPWQEGLDFIADLNQAGFAGYHDWKLPNRKELFSLMDHHQINPSLPMKHPFINVFPGYYWTSTTCARLPDQAWYIHLGGAKVYRGMKYGSYMIWPVRNNSARLLQTGGRTCFDEKGAPTDCLHTGQDGAYRSGLPFPEPRFEIRGETATDLATGLTWLKSADILDAKIDWPGTFEAIGKMNREIRFGYADWRVPHIIELESLTDMDRHSPALPENHPFSETRDVYWSSTISAYNTDYAWALYLQDGAVGVGYKPLFDFFLWPVRGKMDIGFLK